MKKELTTVNRILTRAEQLKATAGTDSAAAFITLDEYEHLTEQAKKEITRRAEELKEIFIPAAEVLFVYGTELLEDIRRTDEALQILHTDLLKDTETAAPHSPPEVWRVAEWARLMALSYQYKAFTGKNISEIEKAIAEEKTTEGTATAQTLGEW